MATKKKAVLTERRATNKGSILLMAAAALLMLGGVAAVAIDTGYMMVSKAEIQNVADVSSNSGTLELARIYGELDHQTDVKYYTLSSYEKSRIVRKINEFSKQNEAAGRAISIADSDAEFGHWEGNSFVKSDTGVKSVRVKARRDASANGLVTTLMAKMVGMDEFAVAGQSAGALSGAASLAGGKAEFPVGIDETWFSNHDSPCGGNSLIKFYPTGTTEGCAGWHTFTDSPANANKLKSILTGMMDNSFSSPEFVVGETSFMFTGGTVASALQKAEDLFEVKKDSNGEWRVLLPVYEAQNCKNPTGWIKIVGVASATITGVTAKGGKKELDARVSCDITRFAKPGGPDYGVLSSRPQIKQ